MDVDPGTPGNVVTPAERIIRIGRAGSAPAFYYDGDPPAWANQGTAGNIPLTGALTASDPAPELAA